jgi:hypothetical protein
MDFKKLFIGTIVAAIVYFLLGYLFYAKLFMDFFHKNSAGPLTGVDRETMIVWIIALGNIAHGLLLSYIFLKANVSSFASGLVTGGLIGLLMSAGIDLIMYGTTNLSNKNAVMADVAIVTVMSAVAGAIVGMIMGMGKKAA